jgi:endonuclease-8
VPEGDTLHRIAARLRPALEGQTLRRFDAPRLTGPRPRPGTRIESVEAVGKHLLVRFDGGLVLQTHLQMAGSWHLYRTGERWRRPPHLARVVLEVEGWVAVCFAAPTVRTFVERDHATPAALAHLGPDLCVPAPDIDEAVRRSHAVADPRAAIATVLLDQRVAAGIGNIYKSETLFACRVDPFTPLDAISDDTRRRLFETAARLLLANASDRTGGRSTVPGGVAVYGRTRRPCIRCGTPIRVTYQGSPRRSTYWCPRCQAQPRGAP